MKVLVTELWTKAEFLDAGVSEHVDICLWVVKGRNYL